MIPLTHLRDRRRRFLERLPAPALLFAGGLRARNTPFGHYPYRADSNFLLFFANPEPDSAAFFDPDDRSVTLFVPERTVQSALWEGDAPGFAEVQEAAGVDAVLGTARLEEQVRTLARGRHVLTLAVADGRTAAVARAVAGEALDHHDPDRVAPPELVDALAELRLHKAEPEIAEIRRAAEVTREAFLGAMAGSAPGVAELELAAGAEATYLRRGCSTGYTTILSVRGEVLHNHSHAQTLQDGDLVLMDSGAEVPSGYGADVTRAWPAGGRFTPEQRAVYDVVLAAHRAAAADVRPGARWRAVHERAATVIAEGLVELGLLRGAVPDLLSRGAHTVFFPHGVGHFLGLDTHDLRIFGDRVLYPGRARSTEFGTDTLRMDVDLDAGMVVTVEPGIYFVPTILRLPELRRRFEGMVDFARAEEYTRANGGRGFGGVRIENDLLVTPDGHENLTPGIPEDAADVEAAVGDGRRSGSGAVRDRTRRRAMRGP